jgi:hypothetical protein
MKILFISLEVLLLAFIIVQLFALNGQKNIETYPYVSIKNTTHLKSAATRQVCLRLSNSPQKNLKRHPVKGSPF